MVTLQRGTRGKQTPRIYLTSPTQTNQQAFPFELKSSVNSNKISPSLSELNSMNNKSNFKDSLSIGRSSSSTNLSIKSDLIQRPSSTPVDRRCQRINSSNKSSIEKETCQLLGPQLCSDCSENETRSNLSSEHLPNHLIRQRLSSLAIRSFISNQQYLTLWRPTFFQEKKNYFRSEI
jgi:hypothetical protein